jgi:trehalose 6-phosphate phosphatase
MPTIQEFAQISEQAACWRLGHPSAACELIMQRDLNPDPLPSRTDTALSDISLANAAFFFDLDGTLTPIMEQPDDVALHPATLKLLAEIYAATNGALAVVSGRPIETLLFLLAPLDIPLAGSHGVELKLPGSPLQQEGVDLKGLAHAVDAMRAFARHDKRLRVEVKPASVALHYRQAPEHKDDCLALVESIVKGHPQLEIIRGKMVVEIMAGRGDKGSAIAKLATLPAFKGRLLVFAGDDVTDEAGFRWVGKQGGITIKVGTGPTTATQRVDDVAALIDWMGQLSEASKAASGGKI